MNKNYSGNYNQGKRDSNIPSYMANEPQHGFWNKFKNHAWTQKALDIVYDTPIEIFLGIVTFGAVAFGMSYNKNKDKANHIPLAFSEIEKTTYNYRDDTLGVPALTRFYSVTNDVCMKVFEAHNKAGQRDGGSMKAFAYELEKKIDPTQRTHALISDYAAEMDKDSKAARKSLSKQGNAKKFLPLVSRALSNTWDESHHDVYHTEFYTVQVCSGTGSNRSCHSELRSRQVYDYTNHSYDYHAEHGQRSSDLMNNFIADNPDMNISEQLVAVTETEADNEDAIYHSMVEKFKDRYPTKQEYLEMANMWRTGSNLTKYMPKVLENFSGLRHIAPEWAAQKETAHDDYYRTYSHHDSGPKEYQTSKKAQRYSENMTDAIQKITDGVEFANKNIPILNEKAKEFVDAALHGGKGNVDELGEEIMDLTAEIYDANFEDGFDVTPFSWGNVILWTTLGAVAGGVLGTGVDRLIAARQRRRNQQKYGYNY